MSSAKQSQSGAGKKTIQLVKPHEMQLEILKKRQRYNVLACGRRFGKTQLLAHLIIMEMLRGGSVGFFAPVHKDIAEVWRLLYRTLSPVITYKNEQEKHLEIQARGVGKIGKLDLWGVDKRPDAGRGRDYSRVLYDEASLFRDLKYSWTQAVRPTLSKTRGDAWFAGTPKGYDEFKAMFDLGDSSHDSHDPRWISWQLPTRLNPYIRGGEIDEARKDMPLEIFQQEYEAKFNEKSGYLFNRGGIRFYDPEQLPSSGYVEAMGLDFAYSSKRASDYSVAIVGRVTEAGDIYITDIVRQRSPIDEFLALVASYGIYLMGAYIGGQEGGILDLALQTYDIDVERYPATQDKFSRALPSISLWNRGKILLPAHAAFTEPFLDEVLAFSSELKDNRFDDQIDGLGSLVEALRDGFIPVPSTRLYKR